MLVPRGFVVLEDDTIFAYNYYSPECDRGIAFDWILNHDLSAKDTKQPLIKDTNEYGVNYYA